MKAISIKQYWASFLAAKFKTFETRSWPTSHRGPIAIHASKDPKFVGQAYDHFPLLCDCLELVRAEGQCMFPLGAIVGVANLTDCIETETTIPESLERDLGNWNYGRWAWKMENAVLLKEPIPTMGAPTLWDTNQDVEDDLLYLLNNTVSNSDI